MIYCEATAKSKQRRASAVGVMGDGSDISGYQNAPYFRNVIGGNVSGTVPEVPDGWDVQTPPTAILPRTPSVQIFPGGLPGGAGGNATNGTVSGGNPNISLFCRCRGEEG